MNAPLLTRDQLCQSALKRDGHRCVVCRAPATVVHSIVDNALFSDGGHDLANAVSLCEEHRLKAEQTLLTCEELRELIHVGDPCLPEHLSTENGESYDRWGNPYFKNGRKYRGELWWEETCQKALASAGLLKDFCPYVHYPRTMHLPWSPNLQNDDRRIESLAAFQGEDVVVTLKMDGESATLYQDYYHARSLDSRHHPSRDWIKAFHARIAHEIPPDWRLCGENLFAQHSIRYDELESFFYLFNIWERGRRLSWDDTLGYAAMLGLTVVPVLYRGPWNEKILRELGAKLDEQQDEGYVVSLTRSFRASEWRTCAAKYVRPAHVRTTEHWMTSRIIPNGLKKEFA